MPDRSRNIGASVRKRLPNLAHARGQPMELLLTRYALKRLLHRLSLSHRERFVLDGAMPLATWFDEPHRATRDVGRAWLRGCGGGCAARQIPRNQGGREVDDGVSFDLKGRKIEPNREEVEYGGSRLRTTAAIASARIPITVAIGFGDAAEPGIEDIDLECRSGLGRADQPRPVDCTEFCHLNLSGVDHGLFS